MMGGGIATASAGRGIECVLMDVNRATAENGKARAAAPLERRVRQGRMTAAQAGSLLERIAPTDDYADLDGSDLVIEAVFEDRAIKASVTRAAEAHLADDAVFASNTSTLPITGLAEASVRPAKFIGLHFFSPVEKMPLVEVIRGAETGDAAVATALDYVQAIGKTPIVVNDGRGFFTSRVFATFVMEGIAMLKEGVAPALIENAAKIAGMPVGPLEVVDNTSLNLSLAIRRQWKKDLGDDYTGHPAGRRVRAVRRDPGPAGPQGRQGLLRLAGRRAETPVAGVGPAFRPRRRPAGCRRGQTTPAPHPVGRSPALPRRGRGDGTGRRRCRLDPRLGLPDVHRRRPLLGQPDRRRGFRRAMQRAGRQARRAVRAARGGRSAGGVRGRRP